MWILEVVLASPNRKLEIKEHRIPRSKYRHGSLGKLVMQGIYQNSLI